MPIREAIIYLIVAVSSLVLISYTVHMFIGGLVSDERETQITLIVMGVWFVMLCVMGWDIYRRRRGG